MCLFIYQTKRLLTNIKTYNFRLRFNRNHKQVQIIVYEASGGQVLYLKLIIKTTCRLLHFTLLPCTVGSETILGDDSDQLPPIFSVPCDGD